jgi:hypothetical protein
MRVVIGPALAMWSVAFTLITTCSASLAAQQYPVAPASTISTSSLTREPRFSGYVSMRETLRNDTASFAVNRARIAVQALPAPFVAVRLQADFAATGTNGDFVPAITDAFIQLAPPDTASWIAHNLRPAVIVGQFRTPFSMEYLTSFSSVVSANRSLGADMLSPRRDRGLSVWLRFPQFVNLAGAIVDGEGSNRTRNPDGKQMALGRLTLLPVRWASISGKWAGQGADHRWGYDARFVPGNAIIEGELIEREGPLSATATTDARAVYVLAAYRVRPWVQPLVKWEQLHDTQTLTNESGTFVGRAHTTLTTAGVNLLAPDDRFRAQLNWIHRSKHSLFGPGDEVLLQLQALF